MPFPLSLPSASLHLPRPKAAVLNILFRQDEADSQRAQHHEFLHGPPSHRSFSSLNDTAKPGSSPLSFAVMKRTSLWLLGPQCLLRFVSIFLHPHPADCLWCSLPPCPFPLPTSVTPMEVGFSMLPGAVACQSCFSPKLCLRMSSDVTYRITLS